MDIDANKKIKIEEMLSRATALELELVYLPKIMSNQTDDEKAIKDVAYKNGKGLNKLDVGKVTEYYNLVKDGFHLNIFQVIYLRRVLQKYWRQFISQEQIKSAEFIAKEFAADEINRYNKQRSQKESETKIGFF